MVRWLALILLLAGAAHAEERPWNPKLANQPPGTWVKLHEQQPGDAVVFRRQPHGGSAFDAKRGRLVLFGSDTHGEDWSNSPRFFELAGLSWTRAYADDDPATYRVSADGIPVAGPNGDHPWAMHTYGTVVYRDAHDDIIVAIYPAHLVPGRFTDAMAKVWPQIRKHPTWRFDLATSKWEALPIVPQHFFPFAATYDRDRDLVYGYRWEGAFALGGTPPAWRMAVGPGRTGYHNNLVYDSRHKALVVFGSHQNSNDVVVYNSARRFHDTMPTPGKRPPPSQYNPMAFHARLGRTVVMVDEGEGARRRAQTWTYDLGTDTWSRIAGAALPFPVGMNYNLVYDAADDALVLVANPPDAPTAVWALRLR